MSTTKETENKFPTPQYSNPGFKTALYIDVPNDINEGLENLRINSQELSSVTPRVSDSSTKNDLIKNYISSDLMRRLEETSPMNHTYQSFDYSRKISELGLFSKENKIEEEVILEGEEDPKHKESSYDKEDDQTQKMEIREEEKIKLSSTNNNQRDAEENKSKKEEASYNNVVNFPDQQDKNFEKSIFDNYLNFDDSSNSPQENPKKKNNQRRDSSPICSYYEGTTDFLSQSLIKNPGNDSGLGPSNNYIKKIGIEENKSYPHMKMNVNAPSFNKYCNQGKTLPMMNDADLYDNMFNQNLFSFNNGPNLFNETVNDSGNNLYDNGSIFNVSGKQMNSQFNQRVMSNILPQQVNINNNFPSGQVVNSSVGNNFPMNPQSKINQGYGSIFPNPTYCGQSNPYNPNQMGGYYYNHMGNMGMQNGNFQPVDKSEDYIVEMFGRRGWICEKCNNFNYESKGIIYFKQLG